MEFVKTIIEKLKLNELFGIVFIAAVIITFIPTEWAQKIQMNEFRTAYQSYISLCIILIGSYYLLVSIRWIAKQIRNKFHNPKRIAISYMKTYMSAEEMGFLIEKFYDNINNRFMSTAMIEYGDGRKAALESKYILYRSSNLGNVNYEFSCNLQPFAQEFLNINLINKNIEILGNQFKYHLK